MYKKVVYKNTYYKGVFLQNKKEPIGSFIFLYQLHNKLIQIFYCDPYSSCQKAEIERNHQFIRFYYPKSKSFKDLTQEELELMLSHINSYNRKNKEDKAPYEIFEFIYGKESLDKLNIKKIEYDEIDLTEKLLRDFRKKKKN